MSINEELQRLREENDALKAQVERLKAPVSDTEWNSHAYNGDPEYILREDVDALIAARASAEKEQE